MHERLAVVFEAVEIDGGVVVDAARFEQENLDGVRVAVVKNGVEETTGELMTVEYHASLSNERGNEQLPREREGEKARERKEKKNKREREKNVFVQSLQFSSR